MKSKVVKALTIAGSDSGGGAGIQADLKTFAAFGVFGMSAVTALTAQNTADVQSVLEVSPEFVVAQIECVLSDLPAEAVKTGMLAGPAIVAAVAECLARHNPPHLVVDPVMIAKSGAPLLATEARAVLAERLLPLAEVVTPNLSETEELTGLPVKSLAQMKDAAVRLSELGDLPWVVVKGGHLAESAAAIDVVYDGREITLLEGPFFPGVSVHGTGCTFSAAIAAGLAGGRAPLEAIRRAKEYVARAIETRLAAGRGHPAPNHLNGVTSDWV